MRLNDKTVRFRCSVFLTCLLVSVAARAAIEVPDDAGNHVRLARPAQRIVSLAPHITELLFAVGAGDTLVGASEYSDYPPAARRLPRIGGGNGLDLEAILALRPDLVIAWGSGNPRGQVERLRQLGLPVFVSEPRVMTDIVSSLERFGELSGHEETAALAVDRFEAQRAQLARRYSGRRAVRVFFQIWDQPLMTVNGAHLISDVNRLCGGINVFADLTALAPQIGVESVLKRNPQAIVAVGEQTDGAALQAYWQRWPELAAVREAHVYMLPRELLVRHTPRILQGAQRLCVMLDEVRTGRMPRPDRP